jgi:Periplasmic protein involved in polysaccharide export
MCRSSATLVLLLSLAGCGSALVYDYAHEPDPRREEYIIGAADVLYITVWQTPDLSINATVRPDGTITMPLIGDVAAAGRTSSALRAEITNRLKSFVKDEALTVSVAVTEINSYQFTLAGNVERPGLYNARRFITVTEAVAMSGGPNRFAALSKVVLIRPKSGGTRRIPIDLGAIYAGTRPEMNIVLVRGDTLHLP